MTLQLFAFNAHQIHKIELKQQLNQILKMKKFLLLTLSMIILTVSSCSSSNDRMKDELMDEIKADIVANIQDALKEINDSSLQELQINLENKPDDITVYTSHYIQDDGKIHVDVNLDVDEDRDDTVIALTAIVVGTIGFFLCPILMVATICYFIYRSKRERNRIISTAISTGYPLPKEFFYQHTPSVKLQSGFIYIAWATGLFLFCYLIGLESLAYLAFIPFIIGIGKIVGWYLSQKKENNKDKNIIIEEFRDDVK